MRAGSPIGDWAAAAQGVMVQCREIVAREVAVYEAQFARNGVHVQHGRAAFVGPHVIRVAGAGAAHDVEAGVVVIATGTTPARTAGVPIDGERVVDTDGVLDLPAAPRSLVIVGAGIVGVEYACTFAALGARVTLVDVRERLLPFIDHEIAEALGYQMREAGITLRFGEEVASVHANDDGDRHRRPAEPQGAACPGDPVRRRAQREHRVAEPPRGGARDGRPRAHPGEWRRRDLRAGDLRGRRRGRLSRAGLGGDGAGPPRGLPRVRPRHEPHAAAPSRTGSTRSPRSRSWGRPSAS